jgi:hypothetical protein
MFSIRVLFVYRLKLQKISKKMIFYLIHASGEGKMKQNSMGGRDIQSP